MAPQRPGTEGGWRGVRWGGSYANVFTVSTLKQIKDAFLKPD